MADDRDDLIRDRAFALWEAEGFPHGRDQHHWEQASRDVAEAQEEGGTAAPADATPSPPAPAAEAAASPKALLPKPRRKPAAVPTIPAAPKGRRRKDG